MNVLERDRLRIYVPGQPVIAYDLVPGEAGAIALTFNEQPIGTFPTWDAARAALMQLAQFVPQAPGRLRRWAGRLLLMAIFLTALAGSVLVVHGIPQPVASAAAAPRVVTPPPPATGDAGAPIAGTSAPAAASDTVIDLDGVACAMFADDQEG